jgi:hypothetical protein
MLMAFLMISAFSACSDTPLLTELKNSSLKVVMKGTYESNSPRDWLTPTAAQWQDQDSIDDYPIEITSLPSTFMIDLADMSMGGGGGGASDFGNYRQTFQFPVMDNNSPFFNGDGVSLKCDDVQPGRNYTTLYMYFRKLLFSDAVKYELGDSGWASEYFRTYFEEEKVNAFNFNALQANYYYDLMIDYDEDINRAFPLSVNISNGLRFNSDEDIVLEVRFVVKNFIKLYEYDYLNYTSDVPYVVHFFGLSDWLRDVQASENYIGGNVLAVARTYVEGKTGTISGTNTTGSGRYVIAIPSSDNINYYTLPISSATYSTNGGLRDYYVPHAKYPEAPLSATDSMPARMNYYLRVEKYRSDWNNFVDDCVAEATANSIETQTEFENEWTDYNTKTSEFKIPPLATYVANGANYTLDNVAPGDYLVYYSSGTPSWGELFYLNEFLPANSGNIVTVSSNTDSPVSIP